MADHLRPWKTVQRDVPQGRDRQARSRREGRSSRSSSEKSQAQIEAIDDGDRRGRPGRREQRAGRINDIAGQHRQAQGASSTAWTPSGSSRRPSWTASRSFYDGMIDRDERGRAREYLQKHDHPQREEVRADRPRVRVRRARPGPRRAGQGPARPPRSSRSPSRPPPGTPADVAGFKKGDVLTVEAFEALRTEAERGPEGRTQDGQAGHLSVVVTRQDAKGGTSTKTLPVTVKPATAQGRPRQGARTGSRPSACPSRRSPPRSWPSSEGGPHPRPRPHGPHPGAEAGPVRRGRLLAATGPSPPCAACRSSTWPPRRRRSSRSACPNC